MVTCTGSWVDLSSTIVNQGATTTGEQVNTLKFAPGRIVGGSLEISVTANLDGRVLTASTSLLVPELRIEGMNPARSEVQAEIDAAVPAAGKGGIPARDLRDALKRMACQESSSGICQEVNGLGQRQFDATDDGGIGSVILSPDNGVGVFQLTKGFKTKNGRDCSSPFEQCPEVLFDWTSNVDGGAKTLLKGKVPVAKSYPKELRSDPDYCTFIKDSINPMRVQSQLPPLGTNIGKCPAPDFTTKGQIGSGGAIGSNPPNELLEDSVRAYNGFGTQSDGWGNALHEFEPDSSVLQTEPRVQRFSQPDDLNFRFWLRVPAGSRGSKGDKDYVQHVRARDAACSH
jgi:hypothetical protein